MNKLNFKKIGWLAFLVIYIIGGLVVFFIYLDWLITNPRLVVIMGLVLGFISIIEGLVFYELGNDSAKKMDRKLDLIIEKLSDNNMERIVNDK